MNSERSNNLSLKYQEFTQSGCGDKVIRKFEFLAKTYFLYKTDSLVIKKSVFMQLKTITVEVLKSE